MTGKIIAFFFTVCKPFYYSFAPHHYSRTRCSVLEREKENKKEKQNTLSDFYFFFSENWIRTLPLPPGWREGAAVRTRAPDDVSIQAAIEANDAFIERLEAIRDAAQGLTIDQGTD
jgi:hypothetical protein